LPIHKRYKDAIYTTKSISLYDKANLHPYTAIPYWSITKQTQKYKEAKKFFDVLKTTTQTPKKLEVWNR